MMKVTFKPIVFLSIAAGILWTWMFSPLTRDLLPFWPMMTLATGLLAGSAVILEGRALFQTSGSLRRDILLGLGSAIGLYAVFWIGKYVSERILPFAGGQIDNLYATRSQGHLWIVGCLLLFWIGPAEEIFWRGFVQQRLGRQYGGWPAYLLTLAVYTLVHVGSFNLMLLSAAFCCGLLWGWMFWRFGSIRPGIISHAAWDVLIFVLFPLT